MGVDLVFELQYLLSDVLGEEIVIEDYSYSDEGVLCVEARVRGEHRRACIEVKRCKAVKSPGKRGKCIVRFLSSNEKALEELRSKLLEGGKA